MSAIRLTKKDRDAFIKAIFTRVDLPEREETRRAQEEFEAELTEAIQEAIPEAEMEVLRKHDCLQRAGTVFVSGSNFQISGVWLPAKYLNGWGSTTRNFQAEEVIGHERVVRILPLFRTAVAARKAQIYADERSYQSINSAVYSCKTDTQLAQVFPEAVDLIRKIVGQRPEATAPVNFDAEQLRAQLPKFKTLQLQAATDGVSEE